MATELCSVNDLRSWLIAAGQKDTNLVQYHTALTSAAKALNVSTLAELFNRESELVNLDIAGRSTGKAGSYKDKVLTGVKIAKAAWLAYQASHLPTMIATDEPGNEDGDGDIVDDGDDDETDVWVKHVETLVASQIERQIGYIKLVVSDELNIMVRERMCEQKAQVLQIQGEMEERMARMVNDHEELKHTCEAQVLQFKGEMEERMACMVNDHEELKRTCQELKRKCDKLTETNQRQTCIIHALISDVNGYSASSAVLAAFALPSEEPSQ
jgi:hypothetical protein